MKKRFDRGAIGVVILLGVVVIAGWVAYTIGQFYFDHSSLENEIGFVADEALSNKRGDPKEMVMNRLDLYRANYDPEKISIEYSSDGKRITIRVPYDRMANFMVTQIPIHFEVYVQKEGGKGMGMIQSVQDALENTSNTAAQKYQKAVENAGKAGGETQEP